MNRDSEHYEIDDQTRRTARHHQAIARRNRQRHRYGNARCRPDLPSLHDCSELWRRACHDCDYGRSIGCQLAARTGNRLSNYRRKGRVRSLAGTRTALRYCERRGDKCRRRDGRLIRSCGSGKIAVARFPVVSIVPSCGIPVAACLCSTSAKMRREGIIGRRHLPTRGFCKRSLHRPTWRRYARPRRAGTSRLLLLGPPLKF